MQITQSFIDEMYKKSQSIIERIERSSDPALFDTVAQFAKSYVARIPDADYISDHIIERSEELKLKYYNARSDLKRVPFEELIDMLLVEMNVYVKKTLQNL